MSVNKTNPSEATSRGSSAKEKITPGNTSKGSSQERVTVLQTKLYQAAKQDPKRRFHALYDKLTLSYVLSEAWKKVRENRGKGGIDGQTLHAVEEYGVERLLQEIEQALREKTYQPVPLRRVYIPKGNVPKGNNPKGKSSKRPLGIPTIRDRIVQTAAKIVLEPIFEADFEAILERENPERETSEQVSYGYRPGIGAHDALDAVTRHSQQGYRWVVDADIEAFFDNLDHQKLMEALRRRISDGEMLRVIWKWLKAGYLEGEEYHDTDQGSPQGGVISPLLANIYLHNFDQAQARQKEYIGKLTRYADDFIIQCGSAEQAHKALAWARKELDKLGLRLNEQKTRVVNDREEGFEFLSFHHQRLNLRHGKRAGHESRGVLRWPNRQSCQKFRQQIRKRVGPPQRLRNHWKTVTRELAQYLQGWSQYFRHGDSIAVFRSLDYYVRERVARNLARSQPTGKKRKRRTWKDYVTLPIIQTELPSLVRLQQKPYAHYSGQANARWRAV